MKNLYIIAGEASGDLQAAKLMKEANKEANISWSGIGGDRMKIEGLNTLIHCSAMAFIGFVDVIKNIRAILSNMNKVKKDILLKKPDAIILVDYPGFNLKIAKFAKKNKIKVFYYITPQLWAWHKSRVYQMRDFVDEIINIFPFEVEFYKSYGIESNYFGHPLTEGLIAEIDQASFLDECNLQNKKVIGLLAGSRESEVRENLPKFIEAFDLYKQKNPEAIAVISKVSNLPSSLYTIPSTLKSSVIMVEDKPYSIMKYSEFVLICSGTATLETACFNTPMIVCYHTGWLTSQIVKRILKIEHISLVNIIYGSKIVPELLQDDFTVENLFEEMKTLEANKSIVKENLKKVENKLKHEDVSKNVAKFILSRV